MTDYPRRDFLKLMTHVVLSVSGLLGLDGLLRYLSYSSQPQPQTEFDLGPAAEHPVGSRTLLPNVPAILLHSETGFSALSMTCPHLGCTVDDGSDGLICPCHGSTFDVQGKVQRGPAQQDLRVLRVEIMDDGQLRLYLD